MVDGGLAVFFFQVAFGVDVGSGVAFVAVTAVVMVVGACAVVDAGVGVGSVRRFPERCLFVPQNACTRTSKRVSDIIVFLQPFQLSLTLTHATKTGRIRP